ncbi:MAG TPA: HemK/PrmC family methyltransferase [Candidatus Acidoferrales bacterium]|nr:HemK/PrmC family methyltransferase [Candidatus Acidoferrales bacterium]
MPEQHTSLKRNPLDVRAVLRQGISLLGEANVPSHALAAELLLMHALGRDRAWIYSNPESAIDRASVEKYFELIARRAAGEPTQYIVGKQEFWGLEFEVNPSVLIPRPETEHVVEAALKRLPLRKADAEFGAGAAGRKIRIADVGTGSGCIAVALAKELPKAEIIATDLSMAALKVAQRNADRHHVADRLKFIETDLLAALLRPGPSGNHEPRSSSYQSALNTRESPTISYQSRVTSHELPVTSDDSRPGPHQSPATDHQSRRFDLIVSNPPYVARSEAATLQREVREHEPDAALFGGPTGTEVYGRLIEQAAALLVTGGNLVLELGYDSAPHVSSILEADPNWRRIEITNDLAGIPRVIAAERL